MRDAMPALENVKKAVERITGWSRGANHRLEMPWKPSGFGSGNTCQKASNVSLPGRQFDSQSPQVNFIIL